MGKKEEKGKENKRVENSRIRVRETCLVYFILGGKKYTVYGLFSFDKIDPLEDFQRNIGDLEIIII